MNDNRWLDIDAENHYRALLLSSERGEVLDQVYFWALSSRLIERQLDRTDRWLETLFPPRSNTIQGDQP